MIAQGKKRARHIVANQAEVGEFFRVSLDTVASWRKKGMPGASGRYDLAEILVWLRSDGPWRPRGGGDLTGGPLDELIVAAGDSPNLERYRLAKAQLAELELERQKGSLLPREKVRSGLGRFAAILRQLGERLGKRHGPEVFGSVNDALDDCQRVIDDEFGRCDDIPDDAA